MQPGHRVVVKELAETPAEALAEEAQTLALEVQQPPDPATLGPRDVIVEIKSAQVGWVDLLMTSGQYQHLAKPPYCPGLEYAGVVAWIGPEVTHFAVGARVLVDGFHAGPRSLGLYQQYGGYASYGVAPAHAVRPLPGTFDFDQGCNLLGNYETAWHCLIHRGQLKAGETVLIHGATGATGLAAVHIAKILGATVIATGRSEAKLAVVKAQGADHVITTGKPDGTPGVREFRDDIKQLTNGKRVDVVYDGVGGDISLESLHCMRFGARYLIVGWAATPNVSRGKGGRGAPNANVLPTNLIMMKGLSVLGCPMVISTVNDPSIREARFAQVWDWAERGLIAPHISHRYPLSQFKEAMRKKWSGDVIGGCVVHPGA